MRAAAGLSQRELSAKAAMPASTIDRIEACRRTPSWTTMATLAEACGFYLWAMTDTPLATPLEVWPFQHARDEGERHLPPHLDVWRLNRASQWSSFHKYSSYARPPFPEHSYRMRPRVTGSRPLAADPTVTADGHGGAGRSSAIPERSATAGRGGGIAVP